MKYLSAYALAWLSGKTSPTVKDLEAIISAVGGSFDKQTAETVVESLQERDLPQIIRAGFSKLQVGGGSVSVSASSAPAAQTSATEEKKEDKKDDKKDEEADFDGALDMFGGDDY
ncbi:hypothetical protein SteCoe_23690 [Stentor coeruleus]|uniref:60S acidic ribosomal protein P2 n=1 Tax=Stentor coeruleus TaxID=5963 RepID=A0A1R2BJ76_9CILI|nr:hypothetical protein SteCoe_23690 [Stentor coeruleus]